MASLFALGVMSIAWMAVVAGLIAIEKLLPWRRVALYGTTVTLAVLGALLLAAPGALPGLTIPGTGSMPGMSHMSKMDTPPAKQMPGAKSMPSASKPGSGMGTSHMGP
jgi:predicted metal-binding membrane protein